MGLPETPLLPRGPVRSYGFASGDGKFYRGVREKHRAVQELELLRDGEG